MNYNLLKAKIAEKGETQQSVAKAIGISENSLSRKMTGIREFRLSEVIALCEYLEIEDPAPIFFAPNVPNTQRNELRINLGGERNVDLRNRHLGD